MLTYERMTELLWEESMKRIVRRISSLQRQGVVASDPRIEALRSRQMSKAGSSNRRYEERKKANEEKTPYESDPGKFHGDQLKRIIKKLVQTSNPKGKRKPRQKTFAFVDEGVLRLRRQIKALSKREKALPAEDVEGVIGAHQTKRSKEARLKYKEKAGSERRLSQEKTELAKGRAAKAGSAVNKLLRGMSVTDYEDV